MERIQEWCEAYLSLPCQSFIERITSLRETCLPTKHNMADCECQNDASEKESQIKEKKAKGPEKDLQAIFMKLRVDSGP